MKNILFACIICLLSVSLVSAGENVDKIVCDMLEDGASPANIVLSLTTVTDINPQHIVKALHCCGAEEDDINTACKENDIPELIVIAGFEQAIAECGVAHSDSQAYVPIGMFGSPSPSNRRTPASPSMF